MFGTMIFLHALDESVMVGHKGSIVNPGDSWPVKTKSYFSIGHLSAYSEKLVSSNVNV